jgi:hypothetical protein
MIRIDARRKCVWDPNAVHYAALFKRVVRDCIGVVSDCIGVVSDCIGVVSDCIGVVSDCIGVVSDCGLHRRVVGVDCS